MSESYVSVSKDNSSFKNPRQKTWIVLNLGSSGWQIKNITQSYSEVQSSVKELFDAGGMYMNINRVMVGELIPIDTVITPNV